MDTSQTDGYRMYLKCSASVNNYHHVDMRWSGRGLQQSLWVRQAHVTRQEGYIERKLFFKPWLDLHAGEYTCNLNVRDDKSKLFTVKKSIIVNGKLLSNYRIVYCSSYKLRTHTHAENASS